MVASRSPQRAVCAALAGERVGVKVQSARQPGFQHLFARARVWQSALDCGQFRSLSELAKANGLSHLRVAQVLDLLTLPPEIQAALDISFEELPAGITQSDERALAPMKGVAERREGFRRRWARAGATRPSVVNVQAIVRQDRTRAPPRAAPQDSIRPAVLRAI